MHDNTALSAPPRAATWMLCATTLMLCAGGAASAQQDTWQVSKGSVAMVCQLTVGGRFEAKSAAVTGQVTLADDTRDVAGAFIVDLTTMTTGIGLRDTHLRDNYFEVSRGEGYDTAVLDAIVLEAPPPARGKAARVGFRAVLTLHGRGNPVTGRADIAHKGDRIEVKVVFPVRIDAYAMASPTYLGVGVSNQVEITVRATLGSTATPPS